MRADRQTNRQACKHTETLYAIMFFPVGGEVVVVVVM